MTNSQPAQDTELFELCKQVYEKTRWTTDFAIFKLGERIWSSDHETAPVVQGNPDDLQFFKKPIKADNRKESYEVAPLYNSDYLLDKLPHKTYCGTNNVGMGVAWKTGTDFDQTADTPLKSLLKLTLALHKSGELK